jgi:hypothetical protein
MEVTQQLQPLQDKACQLFLEIENHGIELQQVVITTEKCLEGPVNNALIQCYNPKLHHTCLPGIRTTHIPSLPKLC